MRICGVKTTHDGGVALIDDGRLVFSYEMEKLGNGERYAKIDDLAIVFELLAEHGYAVDDIDHFVLDGWHKTHKVRSWHGQEVEVVLAPYRRGLRSADVFGRFGGRVLDLDYDSYTHYAGHVASGYATSPFAERGEDAFVLAWDGWMLPFLYHLDAASGAARTAGALFPLIGDTYYRLCRHFPPFDTPVPFPHFLGLAGKIMAYVALGSPREHVIDALEAALAAAVADAVGPRWRAADADQCLQVDVGVRIVDRMEEALAGVDRAGAGDADMLASIHEWLRRKLLDGLAERLAAWDGPATRNLCVVGGCGLNIKWNSAIRDAGLVEALWVPPFPNDAGSALGTACVAMLTRSPRRALDWDVYAGPPLAPSEPLSGWSEHPCSVADLAKRLHEDGEPVVLLHGRAELGPRALGNRSILAPATDAGMKDTLNHVKEREPYRPVAPICLEHRAREVFDPGTPDPYMLFDHAVREAWADRVPAVRHLDGTARLQTVSARQNPLVFALLEAYEGVSGIPLLCNTSANFKHCGFFPDVASAMRWGRVRLVWSDDRLYVREGTP